MVFDPSYPDIDMDKFEKHNWSETVYGCGPEDLPSNMPKSRGLGMIVSVYVDSDPAGDTLTRRPRTVFLVYCNSALVYWMSKKHRSIEISSFGSKFCAMKVCTEYLQGLLFKLRMMVIGCDCPNFIYGDNQSVLSNTTMPHPMLKKKSNYIAYHFVCEGTARDEWRITYISTHENHSDMLTKPLSGGANCDKFFREILHHL